MVKVAIDIGHGSDTYNRTGGKGVRKNGKVYEEHDFNSLVAQELDKLLQANNIDTLMVQEPFSSEVGLTERTNYYNEKGVDLVWSIHANAGGKDASGRCAFYWYTAEDSKRLAELFVEEVKVAGYSTHGNGLHASNPDSWTNLHICRETNMTAVLTENGFMTNSEEFELIFGSKQSEYVEAVARIHAKAITRYFNVDFKDTETGEVVKHKPAKKQKTRSATAKKSKDNPKLKVDGVWGKQTTRVLQEVLGTVVDGVISNQLHNSVTKMIVSGITFGKGGSMVIKALQKLIGANADGYLGPNTVRKLQQYLGTPIDGIISDPSMMVRALQRKLNSEKL
ncbi:N-acetylmuramoyl-L-alanine amidase family protein [Sediminibacillus terrae]|uniref:N-acetylmuramoyl-L-alanine amidase family protein n=1 Tax=Sediminibacillus terrae TaxID=1562106 RepID=UPI0012962C96|nr:N-acetylmuramoyl-L-alanine amidase [Sediminibacillus terrae]